MTTQNLSPEVHDNIIYANNASLGSLLGYIAQDAFVAPLLKILQKSTYLMSCTEQSFALGRDNHRFPLCVASVSFTSILFPKSTPLLGCTNYDFSSPKLDMLRSSFQAKVEKIKESTNVQNGLAKPFICRAEIDMPARSMHATEAHAAPVNDMTTLVNDNIVVLEGGLCHLEEQETVQISKRAHRPIQKYVRKVKICISDSSMCLDMGDPIQSIAFLAFVSSLVHQIAVIANVTDSGAGPKKKKSFWASEVRHEESFQMTTVTEGVSSCPLLGNADGGAFLTFN